LERIVSPPPPVVVAFPSPNQRDTETGLLRLAEAAARGEIIGAAYTAIDSQGRTREGLLGAARSNQTLAHYGASRLAHLLLWPEDQH